MIPYVIVYHVNFRFVCVCAFLCVYVFERQNMFLYSIVLCIMQYIFLLFLLSLTC